MLIKRRYFIPLILSSAMLSSSMVFLAPTLAATRVVGMAKFVLGGTVVSKTDTSITVLVTNTSKNAKLFKGKTQVITPGATTKITKAGKKISLSTIPQGAKIKIFGTFDKKSGTITLVRWINVVSK